MGRSFCTTTQIDITKWYILPELLPKSKGKGLKVGMGGKLGYGAKGFSLVGKGSGNVSSQWSVVKDTKPRALKVQGARPEAGIVEHLPITSNY